MNSNNIALLKRFVEATGSLENATAQTGIARRVITNFCHSADGKELLKSWLIVYKLNTWRLRPDFVEKAINAVEQGLDGYTETHSRQIMEIERDDNGSVIIDNNTGQPRARVKAIETKRIHRAPDFRAIKMILGGDAPTPKSTEVVDSPMVQIIGDIDESI